MYSAHRMCVMDVDCGGGTKPTVEECADAFVLLAKSSSITGSSLKIGEFFLYLRLRGVRLGCS